MTTGKDLNQNKYLKIGIAVFLTIVLFIAALFISYQYSLSQPSILVLPGGVTYLGLSPTAIPLK